jgi:hypothetical protein
MTNTSFSQSKNLANLPIWAVRLDFRSSQFDSKVIGQFFRQERVPNE